MAVLKAHRRQQLERRLALGEGWKDEGLVFTQIDGNPVDPESVAKVFERRVAKSGLPRIRFHDLRHSHAAHLIAVRRDSLEISRRLGHANRASRWRATATSCRRRTARLRRLWLRWLTVQLASAHPTTAGPLAPFPA